MPHEKALSLQDLSLAELETLAKDNGWDAFRARQIFTAACQNKDYSEMGNVPKKILEQLEKEYFATAVKIEQTFSGTDGTEKYLYQLYDGNIIEGVFMPHGYGNTLCVSTQVGCRMGCGFCASGLNGLVRNLTAGEIAGQVYAANARHQGTLKERKITNIVLMGSGEPLDNFDNVIKFFTLISAEHGLNVSLRNISLSTSGLAEGIIDLADTSFPVTLSISLHAADDITRESMMPINRKYGIKPLIESAKYYFNKTGRRIIFEYSLISGKNSSPEHAKKLAALLKGMPCHVNLINLNHVPEKSLRGVKTAEAKAFMSALAEENISCTMRRSMGNDIGGACGQLRNKFVGRSDDRN